MRDGIAGVVVALVLAAGTGACGEDDGTQPPTADGATTASTAEDAAEAPSTSTTSTEPACGVSLADVQALLPPASGVTENSTPDPRRCNFTWDDGGPRGIDVAIIPEGRTSFVVPDGFEPLPGVGDESYASSDGDRASAIALVGDDLYAVDVLADGTDATEADLRDLCGRILELAVD